MLRTTFVLGLAALLRAAAWAQSAAAPAFEVASIRPAQQPAQGVNLGMRIDGAQVRATLALKDFIGIAYSVKIYQISGPDWLASEWFDIAATLPAGSAPGQIPEMLQNLLAERFQLKLHRDKKDFPVYALEVGRGGLKMPESPPDDNTSNAEGGRGVNVGVSGSGQGVSVNLGRGSSYTFANNRFEAKKLTMTDLANNMERFLDRPIVDLTGLKGKYDFALDLTEEDYRAMLLRAAVSAGIVLPPQALRLLDTGEPISLFSAVEKLGLKLEARKAPLDWLVIDAMRKEPTEN
jgi:uncharacterized protein (TIGR03435 family)